ncbi:MAG: tetratricopeptide repeat protein [Planctomycetes bacterium]|nr:tetratricopeptide repeat protein [Planctomycetota bacterium]
MTSYDDGPAPVGGSTFDARLARAHLLLTQGRHAQAESEVRAALAADPHDAGAHALLAFSLLGQERRDEAQRAAEAAIGAAPDASLGHTALALVLLDRRDHEGAARAALEAVRLDPDDAGGHALEAEVRLAQRRWADALAAAERALRLDPEHPRALRARASALVHQGAPADAAASLATALARDPDDDETHATLGWTHLHAGRPAEALEHFREALRLDPTNEAARAGMVEALKARYRLYGLVLRYFLFMARLTPGQQWGVIIGGYVGFRVLRSTAKDNPDLAPWLTPLIAVYIAFAALTWIGEPVFNLALRLNRFGRHLLNDDQRRASTWFGGVAALALALAAAGLITGSGGLLMGALGAGLLLLPVAGTFNCESGWPRTVMALGTAALAALGLGALLVSEVATSRGAEALGNVLWTGFFLGAFVSLLAGNALGMVRPRR